jgi:hypothetical protein
MVDFPAGSQPPLLLVIGDHHPLEKKTQSTNQSKISSCFLIGEAQWW